MKALRLLSAATASTFLCTTFAYAAAFQLYELGAPVMGTAGVGQAVINTDASIAYYNPAGMNAMQNSQFMLGTQMLVPRVNFSKNSSNTIAGDNGGNAGVF